MLLIVTTSTQNAAKRLHKCVIEHVAQLATSASNLTSGPATSATLYRALHELRSRSHGAQVYAMVSPFLAGIMRASTTCAGVEIMEVFPQHTGPNTESGLLFVEGAIFWETTPIKSTVRRVPLFGWRRWVMPWARRTETTLQTGLTCCIVDQSKVQALETPHNATHNALTILALGTASRPASPPPRAHLLG